MNSSGDLFVNLPYIIFIGQSNESRMVDNTKATYDIWKGNQHLYHDSLRTTGIYYGVPSPGIYTVILNDSNYRVLGCPGYLKTDLTFDLSQQDANPPAITSMKILKVNEVSPELIHNYDASIKLTAGDFELPYSGGLIYHGIKELQLLYKKTDDMVWNSLTVISNPTLLDSVNGMLYTADLASVLSQFADSAWVDLKIAMTDSAGNSATQILHPAFLVRDAITGIKPVTSHSSVRAFPNPAKDRICIKGVDGQFTITIYASSGQIVKEIKEDEEIDVSDFKPGIYIFRINRIPSGEQLFGKFVK